MHCCALFWVFYLFLMIRIENLLYLGNLIYCSLAIVVIGFGWSFCNSSRVAADTDSSVRNCCFDELLKCVGGAPPIPPPPSAKASRIGAAQWHKEMSG